MKENTFYFSHDYNAHNDVKVLFMRQQLGMEGYGIYWFLIESLANSGGYLPLKIAPVLAMQMHTTDVKVKAVIESFDLFEITEDQFFSARLLKHLEIRNQLSEKGKIGARKRWGNRGAIGVANGDANAKESKGKEIKEKESINIKSGYLKFEDLRPIPDLQIESIKQQIYLLQKIELSSETILSLWSAFGTENLIGEKHYNSEHDVHKHFSNWIKKQKFKNETTQSTAKSRQQITNESLEYIKQKGNELYNKLHKS